jgi:hypothetical protein
MDHQQYLLDPALSEYSPSPIVQHGLGGTFAPVGIGQKASWSESSVPFEVTLMFPSLLCSMLYCVHLRGRHPWREVHLHT